jgi:hypothetical protein
MDSQSRILNRDLLKSARIGSPECIEDGAYPSRFDIFFIILPNCRTSNIVIAREQRELSDFLFQGHQCQDRINLQYQRIGHTRRLLAGNHNQRYRQGNNTDSF